VQCGGNVSKLVKQTAARRYRGKPTAGRCCMFFSIARSPFFSRRGSARLLLYRLLYGIALSRIRIMPRTDGTRTARGTRTCAQLRARLTAPYIACALSSSPYPCVASAWNWANALAARAVIAVGCAYLPRFAHFRACTSGHIMPHSRTPAHCTAHAAHAAGLSSCLLSCAAAA